MTITETQKTAQLAADAAVSAAEAKQYMLEAEQGYQDTSAAAQQAQDAAGSALLSKQSAATSEENSLQYATEAGVARDEAVTAASNASDYAQNKFTFYKTASDPDGTIAGLAATTDGQSFWVAQGPDALSAAWQYQNKAGVAVLQAKQPGTAAITGTIREFPTLAAAQADADAGNIPVGSTAYYRSPDDSALAIEVINHGGTLEPTGRKMPSQAVVNAVETINVRTQGIRTLDYPDEGLEFYDELGHLFMRFNQLAKAFFPHGADVRDGSAKSITLDDGTQIVSAEDDKYLGAETDIDGNTIWGTDPVTAHKIYRNRQLFNNPGQIFGDAAVCGDSISARGEFNGSIKPLSWHQWAALNMNSKFWIKGFFATGGATVADIYRVHIPQVIASGATICVLMAGRNDIIQGVDIENSTIPTLKKAFADLLRGGVLPVVCTMSAQNNDDSNRVREHQLNNWLRAFSRTERLPFVDLHSVTVDPATGNWKSGYNEDVSHPTETGAKVMGRALSDALNAWIAPVYPTMVNEQITIGLTNNMLDNSLFLTLNGTGNAPTGWTAVTAGTTTINTDAAVTGNVWHIVSGKYTRAVTLTPGDKLGFGFKIKCGEASGQQVECYIANGDVSSITYLTGMRTWNRSVDNFSYFYHEFTVPAGVTLGTIVISAGNVDLYVGQIGLFKLSEV